MPLQFTCWWRKKVVSEMQANPMCLKIWRTLLAKPAATNIANDNRKLPAGILLPLIVGWLLHVLSFCLQPGLLETITTFAIVSNRLISIAGFSVLHDGRVLNYNKSCDRRINLGCILKLLSATCTLKKKNYI